VGYCQTKQDTGVSFYGVNSGVHKEVSVARGARSSKRYQHRSLPIVIVTRPDFQYFHAE
jgi:hypothetical protein